METNILENKRESQYNKLITKLTILSLVLTVVCSLDCFINYSWSYEGFFVPEFSIGPGVLDSIFSIFSYLIAIAPIVVFAIYIFKGYKQSKADIAIPISLGLIAFHPIFNFIERRMQILGYVRLEPAMLYSFSSSLEVLIDIIITLSFALATIASLKGFSKKIYIVIAVACGVLGEFVSFISFLDRVGYYISDGLYLYLFTWPLSIIGNVALYIVLLLFILKDRIPTILASSLKKENAKAEKMNPEQELRILKDRLDLGIITEEEYQSQRAEIISKL